MHVLQGGGEAVDESYHLRGGHTRRLPAEGTDVGLVEDIALGVVGGGYEASAVADTHGVAIVGTLSARALFQHLVVDIVADVALSVLVLGEVLDALALGGDVGDVCLIACLPVGILVGLYVLLLAAGNKKNERMKE